MHLTRRSWLAGSAMLAAAPIGAMAAALPPTITVLTPGSRDPSAMLGMLASYAAAELAAYGLPGMMLAISAPGGLRATIALGYADLERRLPMKPGHVVQIGSISKSLVALALFRLAAEGRFDLDAPVSAVLPDAPWPAAPLTVAMLLNHSAALPDTFNIFPRSPDGRLWTNFEPGKHFYYSNLGFNLLGAMLARASGMPFPQAMRKLALEPLGMTSAHPVIVTRDRASYAVGYQQFDDRPWAPDKTLAPAPWIEIDMPAGSVAATAADMLRYIEAWTVLGSGKGGGLLPDALARRLVTPTILAPDFGERAHYANGIAVVSIDGPACLHHTGGMPAFHSSVTIDPAAGGVFASTNSGAGDYRPRGVTFYGARLVRAWSEGRSLPPPPAITAVAPMAQPARLTGRFLAANGDVIVIRSDPLGLVADADGTSGRLVMAGETRFVVDHPRLSRHELQVEGKDPAVQKLWWGATLYGRDRAIPTPPPAASIRAFAGLYQSADPWFGGVAVVARGDALVMEGMGEIARSPDGSWRTMGDDQKGERFWFEAMMDGVPQRCIVGDIDMHRFHDDSA
ncbi:MAG: serine hydrolase domain-containing protein [Janthinobacterium lividum]